MTTAPQGTSIAHIWGRWVVRYRWAALILCVLAAVAAATGGGRLTFANNYRVFFSGENPELVAYEAVQRVYSKNDNILFVVTPKSGKVFAAETLAAIEALTKLAWKIPYSRRVDSVSNFQYSRAKGDELIVTDLIRNAKSQTPAYLAARRSEALLEPLLKNRLIPERTHVTGVNVTLQLPDNSNDAPTKAVAHARELAKKIEAAHPSVSIRLTGVTLLSNAFTESSLKDGMTLIPVMFVVLVLIMWLLLRSVIGVIGTVAVIFLSIATAMGIAGYLGVALTPPSASAPIIIMTLAVADSIHFLVTMFSEMRAGRDRNAAIVESMRINLQPIVLTSVTTAIGFLSMNASDAPPFHDLGNITAIGVMAALVYSLVFLPALVAILPVRVRARNGGQANLMDRLAEFVILRRRPLLWGMVAVVLALFAFIPRIELDDQFVKYFDKSIQFRADTDYTQANLTGLYQFEFSVRAGPKGVSDPYYLRQLDAFVAWLRAQPKIVHVSGLTDIMKRLNRNMHADDGAWYKLPAKQTLAAQYLLLYEMSLPFGLDLTDTIDIGKTSTRVVVTLKDVSAREMREMAAATNAWIAKNLRPEITASATGTSLMFANISERNIKGMLTGTIIALVLISGLLIVAFRSLRFGLISLIPNLIPAGMAFGAWGLLVGQVNMAVAVVTALTLGIVVDDTIHFLSKYLRARRERGAGPEDAVRYAFSTVGVALSVTTLILTAGFLILAQSSFALNSEMGLLTAITIVIALVVDFLLLPPLLIKMEGKVNEATIAVPA